MQKYEDSWITREGEVIKIADLNVNHLNNIIAMLRRKVVDFKEEYLRFDNQLPNKTKEILGEELENCLIEGRDFDRDQVASKLYPNWDSLLSEQRKRIAMQQQDDLDKKEGKMSNSTPEKVFKAGIQRQPGWLYYFDNGNIMRTRMVRGGQKKQPNDKPEVVLRVGINRENGYLYYLDKQGDIARTPTKYGGKAKPAAKWEDGWHHSKSFNPHLFYFVKDGEVQGLFNNGEAPDRFGYSWPILPSNLESVKWRKGSVINLAENDNRLMMRSDIKVHNLNRDVFALHQSYTPSAPKTPVLKPISQLKKVKRTSKPKLVEHVEEVPEVASQALAVEVKSAKFDPSFATVATICLGTASVLSAWKAKKNIATAVAAVKQQVAQEVAA